MKPVPLALIVLGAFAIIGGGWASFVFPVRTEVVPSRTTSGGRCTDTYRMTLWGRITHHHIHVVWRTNDQTHHGEDAAQSYDEWIEDGGKDWQGRNHGPWTRRARYGAEWANRIDWYIHGRTVTREEWERR